MTEAEIKSFNKSMNNLNIAFMSEDFQLASEISSTLANWMQVKANKFVEGNITEQTDKTDNQNEVKEEIKEESTCEEKK